MTGLFRWWLIATCVFSMSCNIKADQNDPRLNALFEQLQVAANPAIASITEQEIWRIWHTSPSEEADQTMRRARRALDEGDMATAVAFLNQLVALEPDYAEAWNQRAIVLYLAEDFDGSLRDINQTLALEPRHFGALSGRGQCYLRLDEPELALEAFEAALDIHPHLGSVRQQLDMLRAYINSRNTPI